MEITFKYQGKIISTPNLEKKLKRMKISLEDIEIIDKPVKQQKEEVEEVNLDLERVIIRSTEDDIRRVTFLKKGNRPPIKDIFKNQIWNPETRTGINGLTEEFIEETMYYES